MISMEPVLRRGYTFWDRALLPPDEFVERLNTVKAAMRQADLRALIVWSDAYHPSADLAYVAGWPMGGALLVTPDGDPAMLTSDNGRGVYFQRWLTWIDETSAAGGRMTPVLLAELKQRGIDGGGVGVVGAATITTATYTKMLEALSDYDLRPFDAELAALRKRKRPRELRAIRTALRVAVDAAAAARRAFDEGASNAGALVAAERSARLDRARDFRGLVNNASAEPDLRPYEAPSSARQPQLLLWAAVDYHGYWADIAITAPAPPDSRAEAALEAMTRIVRPGVAGHDLAQAALAKLAPDSADLALRYGLGHGIGLSLEEGPLIRPKSADLLEEATVLSLRVLAREDEGASFASALVEIGAAGGKRLAPL